VPSPEDAARRQAIAEDPLLAPSLRARTAEVDGKLNVLRLQFLFLFVLIVAAMIALTLYFRNQDQNIRIDRYLACVTRTAEIVTYNGELPGGIPPYPLPTCPPDPRLG
jgi:hypothetical protein